MDEISNRMDDRNGSSWRRYGSAAALVAAGLVAGGVLAGTLSAGAANKTPSPSPSSPAASTRPPWADGDQSKSHHPGEKLLTGTTASKVRAAALAKYPGATVQRVETDSDGVYEAHLVTKAGAWITVKVGKDFTVTGTEAGPGGRHDGNHGWMRGGMRSAPGGTSPESGGAGWSGDGSPEGTSGQPA
jgi:hypothetical protein